MQKISLYFLFILFFILSGCCEPGIVVKKDHLSDNIFDNHIRTYNTLEANEWAREGIPQEERIRRQLVDKFPLGTDSNAIIRYITQIGGQCNSDGNGGEVSETCSYNQYFVTSAVSYCFGTTAKIVTHSERVNLAFITHVISMNETIRDVNVEMKHESHVIEN